VGIDKVNKAVFFDRDGVINELVFNDITYEYEPPHTPDKFIFSDGSLEILKKLLDDDFKLFIISNQPDYAKGKTSLNNLKSVHSFFEEQLIKNNIFFSAFYYCYHHPLGIVNEFSVKCDCRKPGTLFVKQAIKEYNVDLKNSWFIGDRDTDIICGQKSGLKTILLKNKESFKYTGNSHPDYIAYNLGEVYNIISI
jgi:D-glycero-D-manno-heptose 1,7-bisphosphate phosphatase